MSELLLLRCVIDLLCVDWTVHSKRENMLLLSTDKNVLSLSLSCCLRVLYFLCVWEIHHSLQFLRRLVQTTTCTNFSHFSPLVVSCPAITLQYIETKKQQQQHPLYIVAVLPQSYNSFYSLVHIIVIQKHLKKERNKQKQRMG